MRDIIVRGLKWAWGNEFGLRFGLFQTRDIFIIERWIIYYTFRYGAIDYINYSYFGLDNGYF